MGLSETLSKAARERAEQQRQLNAGGQWRSTAFGRDKLWDALNAVCEFVPLGSPELASRKWANLFIAACDQLQAAGEVRRLQAMRYQGPTPFARPERRPRIALANSPAPTSASN
jgi:hypothetical protein